MARFTIDDEIMDPDDDCVEVSVYLSGGERRWCYFATGAWVMKVALGLVEPKHVIKHGLEMNQVTMLTHGLRDTSGVSFSMISVPHLVITSRLSEDIIDATLRYLISQKDFHGSSRRLG